MICYLLLLGEGLFHSRACLIGRNEQDESSVFCRIGRECKIKMHNISITSIFRQLFRIEHYVVLMLWQNEIYICYAIKAI